MLDKYFQKVLRRPIRSLAKFCSRIGITANLVTISNIPLALLIFVLLLLKLYLAALIVIIINRIFDGLDGAIAQFTHTSNPVSGYLDIMVDYLFYISVPLAFILSNPEMNAVAGALLLSAYILSGVNFMASSAVAAKLNIKSAAFPDKALYYAESIIEGAETIIYSLFVCIFPRYFAHASYVFAVLLFLTVPVLVFLRWKKFSKHEYSSILYE